jgi:hypothetical protein
VVVTLPFDGLSTVIFMKLVCPQKAALPQFQVCPQIFTDLHGLIFYVPSFELQVEGGRR